MNSKELIARVQANLNAYQLEIKSASEEHKFAMEALLKKYQVEAYSMVSHTDIDFEAIQKQPWYINHSLLEIMGLNATSMKKKRDKQEPTCENCQMAKLDNTGDSYVCPACGYMSPIYRTRMSTAKNKSTPDRAMQDAEEWLACLSGQESIPPVVSDKRETILHILVAKGFSEDHVPSIKDIRDAFRDKKVRLATHYKHCVAIRGQLFKYYPKALDKEDKEEIMTLLKILIHGFDKLRETGAVKNNRYIPTIIKWCIYTLELEKKYVELCDCIHGKSAETEAKTYQLLKAIYDDHKQRTL